jgi:dihydroneopterin aldolase
MDTITIADLEVHYHVGVPDEEREREQRLLLTVQLTHDFSVAARDDDIGRTIDYYAVTQRLLRFGVRRKWRLIETLAQDIAEALLAEFRPISVTVEVKKLIIPQTRHVSVTVTRPAA